MRNDIELPVMERGVALIIVLVLLGILAMLITASSATAVAELRMAGNEQFREQASNAASSGIEEGIALLRSQATPSATMVINSGAVRIRYAGTETNLPQFSAEKLVGHHFTIESHGASERGAVESQLQGVMRIAPLGSNSILSRVGDGLTGGSRP